MARRTKGNASFIAATKSAGTKAYAARYRTSRPLLQGRVSVEIYREARRRAAAVDFSLSKFLGYWLELTFREHKMKAGA